MSDRGFKDSLISANRLGLPIPVLLFMLVGFASGAVGAVLYIEGRFGTVADMLREETSKINRNVSRNRTDILSIQWCLEARRSNPNFVCPKTNERGWP